MMNRRGLMLAAFSGSLTGCASLAAPKRYEETPEDDLAILNGALALEYRAVSSYRLAAASGLLRKTLQAPLTRFGEDHARHAEGLRRWIAQRAGEPVTPPNATHEFEPRDEAQLLRYLAAAEQGMADTYFGAVAVFADRDLARNAASILGIETAHWALLREALALEPVPAPFIR